ncbi:MAG: hypothetical protein FJZ57_06310 [Chlamydiae bacterium]|nr:hypothetical protein [Chlamydiota bacterium]
MQLFNLQDSFKFRAQNRSMNIAESIFDLKGEILIDVLNRNIQLLETTGFISMPSGHTDEVITSHHIDVLTKIRDDKKFVLELKRFRVPLCHKYAEEIIRDTLDLNPSHILTDRDVRVAVVAACLYPLRQNVGSCFATAPAILIQKEQIENMLTDLYDLLSTGKIVRVISGKEYSVPLSPSYGFGEMKKNVNTLHLSMADIPYSIKYAIGKTDLLDGYNSAEDRASWLQNSLVEFNEEKIPQTVENFFKHLVFKKFSITQDQLDRYYYEKNSFFKHSGRVEIIHQTSMSSRIEKCSNADASICSIKKRFLHLTENILARVWEYSIASFSETKMEFSRWNLFSSLGLNHEESGGLGEIIYNFVEQKIASCNLKLEEYQNDYEIAFSQLRATELLLAQASSESEIRRLKAEFQSRSYHMNACLELRDKFYRKSSFYPHLFSFIIEQFDQRFPEYFQEIYDADMQEVDVSEYEDSPAGFRLVCKHGRRDASLWTMIHDQEQFIDSLVAFFSYAEPQISSAAEDKNCDDDIKEIITMMIHHVRTDAFIQSAFHRSAKLHQVSINKKNTTDLKKLEKKPWSYTSGGVMNTLIKTYYRRDSEITEESFNAKSESDLLHLLIETMKSLPYNFTAYFPENTRKRMLMNSPTHAFLLMPYQNYFFSSWDDNSFTYTWIRDKIVKKWEKFYSSILLSIPEQEFLLNNFLQTLPYELSFVIRRAFTFATSSTLKEFAIKISKLHHSPQLFADFVDSFLYTQIPISKGLELKKNIHDIVYEIIGDKSYSFLDLFPDTDMEFISANLLREICKGVIASYFKSVSFDFDLHSYVCKKAEALCLSPPLPFIFADTNWSQNFFGFVVSPSTSQIKLWRVSKNGYEGLAMQSWSKFFSDDTKESWAVYVKPQEYSQIFERKF